MTDHMTAEQLRELIEAAQAFADSLPRGDTLRYYCRKHELTRLRKALDAARLSGMAAVPEGWKLVPIEPTPEIVAAAAMAAWPIASANDIAVARQAAMIMLRTTMDLAPGATLEQLAATLATMPPAYRAMLAASPEPPHG